MARPKLTKEIHDLAVKLVETGVKKEFIYGTLGIAKSTYWEWLKKGEQAKSGKYKEFYDDINKAESRAIQKLQKGMLETGKDDWRMYKEALAMFWPNEFGEKKSIEVEGENGIKIVIEEVDASVRDNKNSRNKDTSE